MDSEKEKRTKARGTAEDNAQKQKHRSSHLEWSKSDMLQLLSHLENELQTRDKVIATLKAEKAKQFLYQAKYGHFSLSDPLYAVQGDSGFKKGSTTKPKYDGPMTQLDKLIGKQHEMETQMKEQLCIIDKRYQKVYVELEEEKSKHNHDLEQSDSVVAMLQKDREHLQHEVLAERSHSRNLETEVQLSSDKLEKLAKHRDVVMKLLKKRSQIIKDIDDAQCNITSVEETLREVENETRRIEECLTNECLKHLHIESEAKQHRRVASKEHEQLLSQLSLIELHNQGLNVELDKLLRYRHKTVSHNVRGLNSASPSLNLTLLNDSAVVVNESGMASQLKPADSFISDTRRHCSSALGDAKLLPAKVTCVSSGMARPVECSGQMSESNIASKLNGARAASERPADILTVSTIESVNPATSLTVSATTNSGSRISVAVSGPSSQIRKQTPPIASTGHGVPPPVAPIKPTALIAQPQLPVLSAGDDVSRAIPVAQPLRPQAQMRCGPSFPQGRTAVSDKPMLTSSVATGPRLTPVPSNQPGSNSHLAMAVGKTSTVHKHSSQVCVNIKYR